MKVIVIGGTGTIGAPGGGALRTGGAGTIGDPVADALAAGGHEVVRVARSSGEVRVDITSPQSIEEMYRAVGRFDALVSCAGSGAWKPLEQLGDDDFAEGLD